MAQTNWRVELDKERRNNGDSSPLIIYPESLDLDKPFAALLGDPDSFGAWSEAYVYFPISHQGVISVASVPRHPVAAPIESGRFDF